MDEPIKKRRPREARQLPAGRHGLPRQFVVSNQRGRILAAVADVCSSGGYVAMSVEDIVVSAGVSRRTFYDNHRDKQDAFLAAYDEVVAQLLARVQAASTAHEDIVARAREGLRAFLDFIAAEPAFADMCIVEALAAGPAAVERRNAIMQTLTTMIDETAAAALPRNQRPSPIIAETLVGGIYEVIYARVLTRRYDELPGLLPELLFTLLLPYTTRENANAVLKRERRRLARPAKLGGSR